MRRARFLSPWKDSHEKPVIYHCISRVVERRFAFGIEEKERFRIGGTSQASIPYVMAEKINNVQSGSIGIFAGPHTPQPVAETFIDYHDLK